jgi:hypothetical protein
MATQLLGYQFSASADHQPPKMQTLRVFPQWYQRVTMPDADTDFTQLPIATHIQPQLRGRGGRIEIARGFAKHQIVGFTGVRRLHGGQFAKDAFFYDIVKPPLKG